MFFLRCVVGCRIKWPACISTDSRGGLFPGRSSTKQSRSRRSAFQGKFGEIGGGPSSLKLQVRCEKKSKRLQYHRDLHEMSLAGTGGDGDGDAAGSYRDCAGGWPPIAG